MCLTAADQALCVWNELSIFFCSCGLHLLPYCADIEASFIRGLAMACPGVIQALQSALCEWWCVRADCDEHTLAPVVRWLLAQARGEQGRACELDRTSLVASLAGSGSLVHPPAAKRRKTESDQRRNGVFSLEVAHS